jgi:hypothetical protein
MEDVEDYINRRDQMAMSANYLAQDEDPQSAGTAMRLAQVTGAPAGAINTDLEAFQRDHKLHLANGIIDSNQFVSEYLTSHPLHAAVSQNDLGNLDALTQGINSLYGDVPFENWLREDSIVKSGFRSFAVGFGDEPFGQRVDEHGNVSDSYQKFYHGYSRPDELEWALSRFGRGGAAWYGLAGQATGLAELGVEGVARITKGLLNMGFDGIKATLGPAAAHDLIGFAEMAMQRGDIGVPRGGGGGIRLGEAESWRDARKQEIAQQVLKIQDDLAAEREAADKTRTVLRVGGKEFPINQGHVDTLEKVKSGLEVIDAYQGKEPPPGVHPLIDAAKEEQIKADIQKLREVQGLADGTQTKEISSEALENYIRIHGDRELGISAEGIRKLYGEKEPAPDDNLLGRAIPDLAERLPDAEALSSDIQVPIAKFFANVDKETQKALEDYIRVRDGGYSIDETKIGKPKEGEERAQKFEGEGPTLLKPREVINEPIQLLRGSAGGEPMFHIGDRKLTIQRRPFNPNEKIAIGSDMYRILDENGKRVGYIEATPYEGGRKVMVDNIGGFESMGFGPNSFGPALTRSLLKQLMAAYPNMETLIGYRISGARGAADKRSMAGLDVRKFRERPQEFGMSDHTDMRDLLSQNWEEVNANVSALFSVEGKGLAADTPLGQLVVSEINRLTGRQVEADVAHEVTLRGQPVRGVFIPRLRQVIVGLTGNKDALITGWHESLHALQSLGVFTDREWASLEKAAIDNRWVDKYGIGERYGELTTPLRLEEAIAHAFHDWMSSKGRTLITEPAARTVFERIEEFVERLRKRIGELFGHDLDWNEIFEKIDSGEMGAREGVPLEDIEFRAAKRGEAALAPEMAQKGDIPKSRKDRGVFGLFTRARDLGISERRMEKMEKAIEARNKNDLEQANRAAEVKGRQQIRRELRARRTELRDEVRQDIEGRPDIAADRFFSQSKFKIHPDFLSDEQRERLPKDYVQKKNGVNPDDLASHFGLSSGDALVERLAMHTEDRVRSGMSVRDYTNRLIDIETDRRLNAEFIDREGNIMEEYKDGAVSEYQLKLVHEETQALAEAAGYEPLLDDTSIRSMVKSAFDKIPSGQIKFERAMQQALTMGKKVEEALQDGDLEKAFRAMQQRQYQYILARFAKDHERTVRQLDKSLKSLAKKRTNPAIEQEYLNWIHDIALRVGHRINRTVQDLAENIGRQSSKTLTDFVAEKEAHFMGQRTLDIADFLLDEKFNKPVKDLTTREVEGLRQSIKILEKAGRDERSVIVGGENWDRQKTMGEMSKQLATFGYGLVKAEIARSKFEILRRSVYGLTNMETLLNRWDRGSPMGVFNRVIVYPLVEAANGKARMLRLTAKALQDIERPTKKQLQKLVDAPFADPMSPDGQGKWEGFTYGHVLMMLQNAGNKSNWNVLARGLSADPEQLFNWLQRNVTRKDIERAQAIGDIFKGLVKESDKVYERLTGATVQKIPIEPIEWNLSDGTKMTTPGWYHPLVRDPVRESRWKEDAETGVPIRTGSRRLDSAFEGGDYFHAVTSNGYTKRRTGAVYPIDLDFNIVPTRMRQMIHDINFREPLLNIEKIFGDRLFREDVSKYYGREYADGLMPYLRHLAGSEGIRSSNQQWADSFIERTRQNIISTYIGFNVFTIMKHGPTALVMSSKEVGTARFAKAMTEVWAKPGAKSIRDFITNNSEEIQRRERHWQDTVGAQQNELSAKNTFRERMIDWGSKGVAKSDMASAMPTWWAEYQKQRAAGETHGMSVTLADRAVRRAHGSTAETNLPPAARSGGPLNSYMTSVYGFFGTVMQRRIEAAQNANDMFKLGKEGQIKAAAKHMPKLLGDFMTYIVWPTLIEEAVRGAVTEDDRTWPAYLAAGATMGLSSSVLYLRDLAYGLTTGHDPGAGLLTSVFHDVANVYRDVRRGSEVLNREHAGKVVQDVLTLFGEYKGVSPKPLAEAARFGIDLATGQQRPRGFWEYARGVAHGEAERKRR